MQALNSSRTPSDSVPQCQRLPLVIPVPGMGVIHGRGNRPLGILPRTGGGTIYTHIPPQHDPAAMGQEEMHERSVPPSTDLGSRIRQKEDSDLPKVP